MSTIAEPPDDGTLLARLATRDTAAFALLYDRHAPAIFGYAVHLLADAAQAESVVQDAFLSLWRQAAGMALEGMTVRAWLLAVVRAAARERLRRACPR